MTTTADIAALFTDARNMYAAAQERLSQGDLRDAGEKAWCAMNRACTGLLAARTGEMPKISPRVSHGLRNLAYWDPDFKDLYAFYLHAQEELHGNLFYWGLVEEPDMLRDRIREVEGYLDVAERLAGGDFG
jgi:hypothetical protein